MSKLNKYYISIGISALLLLILFTVIALPIIARDKAAEAIHAATGRRAHIGSVSINPFTLTATVTEFAIDENMGGTPLFGCRRFRVSLSPASIYKRALILSNVNIDSPAFSLARTAPNRYNFSDILDKQGHATKQEKKHDFLFSFNNIIVTNGSLDFDDQAVAGGRKHTIRTLNVAIPFISNIPYLAEQYIDPKISALVDGAPFSFAGKLKPLSKSLETSVHISLKKLSLPQFVAYSPIKPPVGLASGNSISKSSMI